MANRRTLDEQLEIALKERKTKQERINKLLARQRKQTNKERTHRLCKRGGLVESRLPRLAKLDDEQFNIFVEKTLLTPHTNRILDELLPPPPPEAESGTDAKDGNAAPKTENGGNGTQQNSSNHAPRPAHTPQGNGGTNGGKTGNTEGTGG